MQTQVGDQFWCMLVEILGPPPHTLINGDKLSAASMSYWLIHSVFQVIAPGEYGLK